MSLFENYRQYARDVMDAANVSPVKVKPAKMFAATTLGIAIVGGSFFCGNSAVAHAEVYKAIEAVSSDIANHLIEVKIEDNGTSASALLSDTKMTLSAVDQAAIAEQIKTSITDKSLQSANGNMKSDGTVEASMTTADGILLTVTISKDENGDYFISKVVAKLDPATAAEKKKQVETALSTDAQKQANTGSIGTFASKFDAATGLSSDSSEDQRKQAYENQMKVLADEIILAFPSSYVEQESSGDSNSSSATGSLNDTDKTSSDGASNSNTATNNVAGETANNAEKTNTSSSNSSPNTNANVNANTARNTNNNGETSKTEKSQEKLAADSLIPYSFSLKDDKGSSISVRAENLGMAFSSMNGVDGAKKMMGYWKETANSVAQGAKQTIKDETEGFMTELFYDDVSGMWGYWGHVVFTDGTRDVIYNRAVFVDELADQMITVSYRHDKEAAFETGLSLNDFKNMIMNAPINSKAVSQSGSFVSDTDNSASALYDDIAYNVYETQLKKIQILPGDDVTVAEKEALLENNSKADKQASTELNSDIAAQE